MYYDPHRPERMTIAGETNRSAWSTMLMVVLAMTGCGTLLVALTGRHAVLALPGGGELLRLRSPRTERQRRRWSARY